MKRFGLVLALVLVGMLLMPAVASAGNPSGRYMFEMERPNISRANNGDTVAVTGMGMFSTNPRSVSGSGSFTHTFASGGSITGTWTATRLLAYDSYGCGVLLGSTIPSNLCGGMLKMQVQLSATVGGQQLQHLGILTIFCIIGSNPPSPHDDPTGEGIHLLVPGIANFNQIVSGMNVYIKE